MENLISDVSRQGRTETLAGPWAKAILAAIWGFWAIFKSALIVGVGPLKWWTLGDCPTAHRVSPPL